MRVKPSGFVD